MSILYENITIFKKLNKSEKILNIKVVNGYACWSQNKISNNVVLFPLIEQKVSLLKFPLFVLRSIPLKITDKSLSIIIFFYL